MKGSARSNRSHIKPSQSSLQTSPGTAHGLFGDILECWLLLVLMHITHDSCCTRIVWYYIILGLWGQTDYWLTIVFYSKLPFSDSPTSVLTQPEFLRVHMTCGHSRVFEARCRHRQACDIWRDLLNRGDELQIQTAGLWWQSLLLSKLIRRSSLKSGGEMAGLWEGRQFEDNTMAESVMSL